MIDLFLTLNKIIFKFFENSKILQNLEISLSPAVREQILTKLFNHVLFFKLFELSESTIRITESTVWSSLTLEKTKWVPNNQLDGEEIGEILKCAYSAKYVNPYTSKSHLSS